MLEVTKNPHSDLSVVVTNYAVELGLVPAQDALFIESSKSPYVNIIAVREGKENRPEFKTLVKCYNNDAVRWFVDGKYKGVTVCAW